MLLAVCVRLHGGDSTTYSGRDHQVAAVSRGPTMPFFVKLSYLFRL